MTNYTINDPPQKGTMVLSTATAETSEGGGGGSDDTGADMKCPCCNNPWSAVGAGGANNAAAGGGHNAANNNNNNNATLRNDFFLSKILCQACDEGKGLSRRNMDMTVPAYENFYAYSNGGWIRSNPIPSGYPNWNTFLTLHVQSQENLKSMLDELIKKGEGGKTTGSSATTDQETKEDQAKLKLFYQAAMDEERIERIGLLPFQPLMQYIDTIVDEKRKSMTTSGGSTTTTSQMAELLGQLDRKYGIGVFFGTYASPDYKNSNLNLCHVCQGGLGLPDRDYYFDEDKEEKRQKYKDHVAKMLTMLLQDHNAKEASDEYKKVANDIYNLESELASSHMTKTQNRDPESTYHKMTIEEFVAKVGENKFDFSSYFVGMGKAPTDLGEINIRNIDALKRVAHVIATVDPDTFKYYLYWHAVSSCAAYLPKAFVEEDFDFYERTLSGTQEMKPRWKRAMSWTEKSLGEVLGKLYCAKYFDEDCKQRALKIVEQVRQALEDRLKEVDWMKADSTREMALKKMQKFNVKIGYPNKWIDYTNLKFDIDDEFLTMVFKSRQFHHDRDVKEMNDVVDREKWFMLPQTVNAYYHPNLNEIVFPAAILQHPFFSKDADDAVNFGAMGAVVGHEMTHGFDDKGRKFNFAGEMNDWWQKEDAEEYESRVAVMVKQAEEFQVHGMPVQGKLTCGENIADLGGLRLAYRALKNTEGFDDTKLIDGFTPTQRFFLAWSQCWRQNITKERSLQLLTLDPHGPNELRCNGPLSNIPEFHAAFNVKPGAPMYKPPEERVDIW